MYCWNCGKEIEDDAAFCGNCGVKVKSENDNKKVVEPQNIPTNITGRNFDKISTNIISEEPKKRNKNAIYIFLVVLLIIISLMSILGLAIANLKRCAKVFSEKKETVNENGMNNVENSDLDLIYSEEESSDIDEIIETYEDYLNTLSEYNRGNFYLFYLNDDEIPELLIDTNDDDAGQIFLSYDNGNVNSVKLLSGVVSYQERQNELKLSYFYGGAYGHVIYKFDNNSLIEEHNGYVRETIYNSWLNSYTWDNEDLDLLAFYKDNLERCFDESKAKSIYDIPVATTLQDSYAVLKNGITSESVFQRKSMETFTSYADAGHSLRTKGKHIFINEKIVQTIHYDGENEKEKTGTTEYEYDANGYLVKATRYHDGNVICIMDYENDEYGNLIKETETYSDSVYTFEYNNKGQIISCNGIEEEQEIRWKYEYDDINKEIIAYEYEPDGSLSSRSPIENDDAYIEYIIPCYFNSRMNGFEISKNYNGM